MIEKSIATGNKAYDNNRIDVYLIEGLMIAIFIGFIIVTAYLISFIEKESSSLYVISRTGAGCLMMIMLICQILR